MALKLPEDANLRLRAALKQRFHRLRHQGDLIRHTSDSSAWTPSAVPTFKEYYGSVETLLRHGTSRQHFQYLFNVYAVSTPHGISRSELLALIQDHVNMAREDARLFERTYTWLKKHVPSATAGHSYDAIAELLEAHPNQLLDHVHVNLDRCLAQLEANNTVHCRLPDDLAILIEQDL